MTRGLRRSVRLAALVAAGCRNDPPSQALFHIEPPTPDTAADLAVVVDAEALDLEDDVVSYAVVWRRDGAEGEFTDGVLPASATARGETWIATMIADDGEDAGPPAWQAVTIVNAVPVVAGVAISPAAPTTATPMTCVVDVADADADTLQITTTWTVQGGAAGTGDTLPAGVAGLGRAAACAVEIDDLHGGTISARSEPVVIANAPPVIASVTLAPAIPARGTPVDLVVVASDFDGDPIRFAYAWYVNGAVVDTDRQLDADAFRRGDRIFVEVAPGDGIDEGATFDTAPVVAGNAVPVAANLTLSPADAVPGDTLVASYDPVVDPDGDAVTLTRSWSVNGATKPGDADSFSTTGTSRDDVVTFTLVPSDATAAGPPAEVSALMGNRPPKIGSASVSPTTITEDSDVTCVAGGATDPDADPVTTRVAWLVNGASVSTSTVLTGAKFTRGDTIACTLTPNDGFVDGVAKTSKSVTVTNAPPTEPVVSLTYESATTWDTLTCAVAVDATDPDGDSVTYAYAWDVDGVAVGADATVVAEIEGTYTCSVTASDGTDASGVATADVAIETYAYSGLLSAVADVKIDGASTSGGLADMVVGDVDGDGDGDLVQASANFLYLFEGPLSSTTVASASARVRCPTTMTGATCANAMAAIDLDDDGTANVALGLPFTTTGTDTYGGAVWLLSSAPSGSVTVSSTTAVQLYASTDSAYFGASVVDAGDFDGDGVHDLFANASGIQTIYGVAGGALWSGSQDVTTSADWTITGTTSTTYLGRTLAGEIDVDGDGYDDLLAGTRYANSSKGAIYLFHGPGSSAMTPSDAGVIVLGDSTTSAVEVLAGGDFDGSGADDIAVATNKTARLFLDPADGTYALTDHDVAISGAGSTTWAYDMAAGDFDGDGRDDLLIGGGTTTTAKGAHVELFLGEFLTGSLSSTADSDLWAYATTSGDDVGTRVRMGDVDGDGQDDLITDGNHASGYGSIYVVWGE